MKDIFKIIVMSFVLAFDIMIVSCTTEIVDPRSESTIERDVNGNYIFNAQLNDLDLTKTFRKEDGSIYWDQNETIKVFYNSQKYGTFTSTNQSASLTASFSGNFNSPVSDSEITQNGIVALYPSENAEYNSNKVLLTVSEEQEAEVGTFKKGLFPSIAQSKSSSLSFYNICGGIKLSVHNEGIKAITQSTTAMIIWISSSLSDQPLIATHSEILPPRGLERVRTKTATKVSNAW